MLLDSLAYTTFLQGFSDLTVLGNRKMSNVHRSLKKKRILRGKRQERADNVSREV